MESKYSRAWRRRLKPAYRSQAAWRRCYIRDRDILNRENVVKRYEMEMNQICSIEEDSLLSRGYPVVKSVKRENLMDYDMFIFCASAKVPAVGEEVNDVRMIQFESNRR